MSTSDKKLRQRSKTSNSRSTPTPSTPSNDENEKSQRTNNKILPKPGEFRILTRSIIVLSVMILVYYYTKNRQMKNDRKFALVREIIPLRMQKFQCDTAYEKEINVYGECVPKKCGRFVSDQLVNMAEAEILLDLARRIITKANYTGSASVLDIHSGALSYGERFINVFSVDKLVAEFKAEHLKQYNIVKNKIQNYIAEQFGISSKSLHLTYPTFFTRITNATAKNIHDEYWHEHVDKETYASFHYTSLLYLNTHGKEFKGGRFIFVDGQGENRTLSSIEPKKGRILGFTSGAENRHHIEQITEGERYAITISFTCNEKLGIRDPEIQVKH